MRKNFAKAIPQVNNFFENIIIPVLTQEQKQDCKKEISEKEVIDTLKNFNNNKSPRNDGLTKKFITKLFGVN